MEMLPAITSLGSGLLVPLVISHIFLILKMSISIFGGIVDTTRSKNRILDASYPTLHNRLFPNLEVQNG